MLDKALGAYISGTLASDPEQADSYSVLPHLTALERRYGSLTAGIFSRKVLNKKKAAVTEGFSFKGGMSTMITELSQQLNDKVHTGYKIKAISPYKDGWMVNADTAYGERSCYTKHLILSTPAGISAKLIQPLNIELNKLLNEIEYAPVSVVHLAYQRNKLKHDVEGTGFLTPFKEALKLNGSMWMHSLFSERAPAGQVLLSNYIGGSRYPELVQLNEQDQVALVHKELQSLLRIEGEPEWARVNSHQQALPLYHGAYTLRQQAIKQEVSSMKGLYLQANYLGGVSIRDRLVCARSLAKQINASLTYLDRSLKTSKSLSRKSKLVKTRGGVL